MKKNRFEGAGGIYTATRQRLDMFTSEEQDILLDVEPIMQSLRRIMHQTGYNNVDSFSAEDKSYILDNVFNYHQDKVAKMGAGIDQFMVSRHGSFQDSRCLLLTRVVARRTSRTASVWTTSSRPSIHPLQRNFWGNISEGIEREQVLLVLVNGSGRLSKTNYRRRRHQQIAQKESSSSRARFESFKLTDFTDLVSNLTEEV